jgi:hypothetical protein
MSWSSVTRTTITGLSASGTTDDIGTWNEDVDLDSFVTVPPGATGVILWPQNTSSSANWLGVRVPGTTTPLLLADCTREIRSIICPLGAGNTIDIYTETPASTPIQILGFTGAETVFFDADALPTITSTGNVDLDRDMSASIPGGAVAAIFNDFAGRWRPTGASGAYTNVINGTAIVPLDGSRVANFRTAQANSILGYMTGGIEFIDADVPAAESATNDDTWRAYPASNAAASFVFVVADKASTTNSAALRAAGDSGLTFPINSIFECLICPTDGSGAIEYRGEADTIEWRTMAWFVADEAVADQPNIMLLGVG